MATEIIELTAAQIARYACVPITFRVTERLVPRSPADPSRAFTTERVTPPFDKDYDENPRLAPGDWSLSFDLARWGLLAAVRDAAVIGGAAIAPAAEVVDRTDVAAAEAVLWDLRVAPAERARGTGASLFRAAERWAVARGYDALMVETQDINVPACRFYERMGCRLVSYETSAYPDAPGEARLIWHRSLTDAPAA